MAKERDNWGSRLGVILAVAGSAVGLGNFLRFPVQVVTNGGGAFLIPYFVALLVVGIPLAWMEWTIGRHGGLRGMGSEPSALGVFTKSKKARYMGALGVLAPMLIFFFYTYIESWLLAFAVFSITGTLSDAVANNSVSTLFGQYITLKHLTLGIPTALIAFILTYLANFYILRKGVSAGIEKFNKIAMPAVLVLGLVLFFRVITLPNIEKGFAYLWNPDFSRVANPRTWLAATGQIFFTLSLGTGAIVAYASYLRKKDDLALSSLTANATNEFAEVIMGGTIVVPLAIVIFGANVEQIAKLGTMGLAFNTLPVIFGKLPLSGILQASWFVLLFFAAITSSISLMQPAITLLEDELGYNSKKSSDVLMVVSLVFCLYVVFGLDAGALDEFDFWGGTFILVVVAAIEAIYFSWLTDFERNWKELHEGALIKIPNAYKFIMKYITPTFLLVVLFTWLITDYTNVIFLKNVAPGSTVVFLGMTMSKVGFIWLTRGLISALFAGILVVTHIGSKRREVINVKEGQPHVSVESIPATL